MQHTLHQIKALQFYTDLGLGLQKTVLNPLANGKIQELFKAFQCFSSTFQANFIWTFQDNLVYSSTFQACANPVYAGSNMWCFTGYFLPASDDCYYL